MDLLKKENWWIWLLISIFSYAGFIVILGAMLNQFKKDEWYTKWYIWVIGIILVIPVAIMIYILLIEMLTRSAEKLGVDGKNYYRSPYLWVLLCIIPIIGWLALIALNIYLYVSILIKLYNGNGELVK